MRGGETRIWVGRPAPRCRNNPGTYQGENTETHNFCVSGGAGREGRVAPHDVGRLENMAKGEVTVGTSTSDGRYGAGGVSNDEVTVRK